MAYGKKSLRNKSINRNPWTRDAQDRPASMNRAPLRRNTSTAGILTGRKSPSRSTGFIQGPNMNNTERRGGARRAPFLSNTGPGKKRY